MLLRPNPARWRRAPLSVRSQSSEASGQAFRARCAPRTGVAVHARPAERAIFQTKRRGPGGLAPAAATDVFAAKDPRGGIMHWTPSRRRVLAALSASAAGLLGGEARCAPGGPPQDTTA